MNIRFLLSVLFIYVFIASCSTSVKFSDRFKEENTGKYLYNPDDIIEVYFVENTLFLKWRGANKIKPVVIDSNEFFVADMYKKLRFVKDSITQNRYLSIILENKPDTVSYDYLKVDESYKTPSTYLKEGNYKKALAGFLEIKRKDSLSVFIDERDFNSLGYSYLRANDYKSAIEVFRINLELHPTSSNVYDSLADAYLRSGDSLNAYVNYKRALELNRKNLRAKKYLEHFDPDEN